MLSSSWKRPALRWVCYALVVAFVSTAASLISAPVQAQGTQGTAAQAPATPATKAPPPAAPTETAGAAKAAATPAPATAKPEKPRAPRLDGSYTQMPVPEDVQKYVKLRSDVQKWLRAGVIPADKQQDFRDYYTKYALARWTWVDHQAEVADFRREIRSELAISHKPNRPNPAHDQLSDLVFQFTEFLTQPQRNFAPTARFNAILMIGELNEVEPAGISPPTALSKALPILLNRLQDPQQVDAVKLGALIGIRRHCRLLMDANKQVPYQVLVGLASFAQMKEPERVRSEEGHAWLRGLAVQIFADVKGAPKQDVVAGMLKNIVAEKDSPAFLRYEAASALGSVDFRKAPSVDMNDLLHTLGLLALGVCDEERQRLRDEMESQKAPTASPYGGYGGYGDQYSGASGEMGMPSGMEGYEGAGDEGAGLYGYGAMSAGPTSTKEDRQIERSRRRLEEGMTAALIGMGKKRKRLGGSEQPSGLLVLAGTDAVKTQNIEAFSNPIHDFFKIIDTKEDDKQIEAKALDEAIADVREKLAEALGQVGPAAPEAPEFKPLSEPKPAGGMYGGYGDMTSGMP